MAREEENNNSRDRSTFWIVEERGNASSADRTSREGRVEERRREESRKGRGETERERQRILAVLISTPMNPARNELEEEEASREQTKCLLQFR